MAPTLFVLLSFAMLTVAVSAKTDATGPELPTTRVVKLLQGLHDQIEEDGKTEEDLYFKFVCWGQKVIKTKTGSNAEAQARIDELKAYLADVDSGKIEFTTEREDLEAQQAELEAEIKVLVDTRKKENKDYEAAQAEMKMAIAALKKAIEVMKEGTSLAQESSLLSIRAKLNEGAQEKAMESAALDRAVAIGQQYLTKGDALFLQRVLTGEVPKADWKKLNRKATFKQSYQARSGNIIKLLEQLLAQFEDAQKASEDKEDNAVEVFSKLKDSLDDQLNVCVTALNDAAAEGAAKGETIENCEEEIAALEKQVENDRKYIDQTQTALDDMKAEYKDRKALRAGELEAISKAIGVLTSDEARDTFAKSYKSQGYLQTSAAGALLLQTGQRAERRSMQEALRAVASKTGDRRLLGLAALVSQGHFDEVLKAIDEMIETLKKEGDEDLDIKEDCEKTRAKKTREAILDSRSIDEMTDAITKLLAEIAEIKAEIKQKKERIVELEEEMKEAIMNRKAEAMEFKKEQMLDKMALGLINKAKDVLESFYKDNDLVLAQQPQNKASATPPPSTIAAGTQGQAPPPPPSTWNQPYGGKTQESGGISSVMQMLADDIQKDMEKAIEEHKTFVKETKASIEDLETAISDLEATMSEKAMEVEKNKARREAKKQGLDATMKTYSDLAPNCDFYQTNFPVRRKNRAIEIDGLMKAKGILKGAAFR